MGIINEIVFLILFILLGQTCMAGIAVPTFKRIMTELEDQALFGSHMRIMAFFAIYQRTIQSKMFGFKITVAAVMAIEAQLRGGTYSQRRMITIMR